MTNKQENTEAIEHQQKMLRVLRRRLQDRELQEAQYGISVPPEVLNDISTLTERVAHHEQQLAALQTIAVEDQLPFVEVEYRLVIAEALDTLTGVPTVANALRQELTRLQLRIPPNRAREIEQEIRTSLAKETFYGIRQNELPPAFSSEALRKLGKAICLEPNATADLVLSHYQAKGPVDLEFIYNFLIEENGIWEAHPNFLFFDIFRTVIRERTTQ